MACCVQWLEKEKNVPLESEKNRSFMFYILHQLIWKYQIG